MPPPPDSAFRFRPGAVVRSVLAATLGYGIHFAFLQGAILLGWGHVVALHGALLVPAAVVVLLLSLVIAGAFAGRLAGRAPGGHGLLVGVAALIVLVAGLFPEATPEPWWFRVVGAAVSLPMAYLGAEVMGYKRPRPVQSRSGPPRTPAPQAAVRNETQRPGAAAPQRAPHPPAYRDASPFLGPYPNSGATQQHTSQYGPQSPELGGGPYPPHPRQRPPQRPGHRPPPPWR